jgi:Bacterial regulatory proteins, luxR family
VPPAVAAAARAAQQQRDPRAALPADPPDGAPEIVAELFVSPTTAKTQMRQLYVKLGAHSRAEAVESAHALRLLAPSARPPAPA